MNVTKPKTGAETYSPAIADAKNYMRWVVEPFRPYLRGRIAEVGIGHGSYCTLLREYGDYIGLDIDVEGVADARQRFPGLEFAACDILDRDSLQRVLPEGVDAVVSINVFEHIEHDEAAVANLVSCIRKGGHLLVSVPAVAALYNDLDRLAGHCRRYSLEQFRTLLQDQPVAIKRLCYFNPVGGLGWWVNSFKKHESLGSDAVNGQIRAFDRYVVPVSRALDPVFRGFFGQSVTCIAERL